VRIGDRAVVQVGVLELVGCGRQRLIVIRCSKARLALMLKRYGIHGEKERDRCADGK
jgi:hypothetical protein